MSPVRLNTRPRTDELCLSVCYTRTLCNLVRVPCCRIYEAALTYSIPHMQQRDSWVCTSAAGASDVLASPEGGTGEAAASQ